MVSDERALAVRLASTRRRRPGPDLRRPRRRRLRPVARLLRRRRRDCWIRHPSSARSRGCPARRSSPCSPRSTALACAASELAVLRPLALVGDDGAPFGAVAARVRAASIARPDAFVAEPPAPPVAAADDATPPLPPSAPSRPSARSPTCCSRACTRPCRAPAPVRSAPSIGERLTDAGALGSADDLDDLVAAAAAAGLVTPLGPRVDRDRRRHAVARSDHDAERWAVDRGGLPRRAAGGSAHRRRRLPAARRAGRARTRCDAEWTERAARLRRIAERWGLLAAVGAEPRVDRGAARRRAPPTPTRSRRTCPPRSTASTCRPT